MRKVHHKKNKQKNQKGQTLVEFIILLAFISVLSSTFMRIAHKSMGGIWVEMVETITENAATLR